MFQRHEEDERVLATGESMSASTRRTRQRRATRRRLLDQDLLLLEVPVGRLMPPIVMTIRPGKRIEKEVTG